MELVLNKEAYGIKPSYVYVASSWRNLMQHGIIHLLTATRIPHYDFKNPEHAAPFRWSEIQPHTYGEHDLESYFEMVTHDRALEGFHNDFVAMQNADTFILVRPCGSSAHLELGWAVGAGKRTAIYFQPEALVEPELMYRMCDYMTDSTYHLLRWLGVED